MHVSRAVVQNPFPHFYRKYNIARDSSSWDSWSQGPVWNAVLPVAGIYPSPGKGLKGYISDTVTRASLQNKQCAVKEWEENDIKKTKSERK